MKTKISLVAAFVFLLGHSWAGETNNAPPKQTTTPDPISTVAVEKEEERRAEKRYEEMLNKMRKAIEEIAQLYGNPAFLQVFTNDAGRASELKQTLKAVRAGNDIHRELSELEKKRDNLLDDIALKEREADKLSRKLVRQRVALDSLATAVDQAREAVENTAR